MKIHKNLLKKALILTAITNSFCLIGQEGEKDLITKEEYEAAIYCDACFNTLDAIDRQKKQLKIQVEARGVMINESKATISDMTMLLDRMKEQYYISEKTAKKAKRKAFWRGFGIGGLAVAVVVAVGFN